MLDRPNAIGMLAGQFGEIDMEFSKYEKLVIKHGGWIEEVSCGEYVARFPSVHAYRQFCSEALDKDAA